MATREKEPEPNSSIKIASGRVSVVPLYLGLGSNLGDRGKNIRLALEKLDKALKCKRIALSEIIESEPWGFESEDKFLNAVVKYEIALPLSNTGKKSERKNYYDGTVTSNILHENNGLNEEKKAKGKPQSSGEIACREEGDWREIEDYVVEAYEILKICKEVECEMGRRDRPEYDAEGNRIYRSRIIDIDILLFGDAQINEADLKIPHPLISTRSFVLNPLLQIAPELREKNLP